MQKNEYYTKWINDRLAIKPNYDFPNEDSDCKNKKINEAQLDNWILKNLSKKNKTRMQASYRQAMRMIEKKDIKLHLKIEAADKIKKLATKNNVSVSDYILDHL
jgi:hypothetical protein